MTITLNGTTGITTPALDSDGTLIADGLTIAGATSLTGNLSVNGGTIKLDGNYPVGTANVALGANALGSNISGQSLTAIGHSALYNNVAIQNTAVGYQAGFTNSTGVELTAVGYWAGFGNTSGASNTSFGWGALKTNTTGSSNHAFGSGALYQNINGNDNIAIGVNAMGSNQSGSNNVGIGRSALVANTTASDSTAVGFGSGYSTTTGGSNTYIGKNAGYNATTGIGNCFVGGGWATSGYSMTTGSKNTILGGFSGNQGGLDIRTSSNNIVLSDGDGNPRVYVNSSGSLLVAATDAAPYSAPAEGWIVALNEGTKYAMNLGASATSDRTIIRFNNPNGGVGGINTNGNSTVYYTSSDYRLKENVVDLTGATARLNQLAPKRFNFTSDADTTVDGFLAHEVQAVVPEAITGTKDAVDANGNPAYQGIDQSKLVPLLVATIQELEARITALEGN